MGAALTGIISCRGCGTSIRVAGWRLSMVVSSGVNPPMAVPLRANENGGGVGFHEQFCLCHPLGCDLLAGVSATMNCKSP
jgi:hypothetical protein